MKILLVDAGQNFLDFAIRCEVAGHDVRVFFGPLNDGIKSKVGDGLINVVSNFESHMGWADIIITSDNAKYVKQLEGYRKRGYPIFGCNLEAASWELDRSKGQKILEDSGVEVMPSISFKKYDDAIAHIKKNPKRYVSKPNGDADKSMSYVSKSPEDLIFMLEKWKKGNKIKDDFILQEFVPGIEMAVGGWFGKNGFSKYYLENFEFKKLMNDDKGVNCYSADTEVLTSDGWKFWPEVTMDDEICTLKDSEVTFEKPSRLTVGDKDKELIHWVSPFIDIMVTPGHNMYVCDDHERKDFWFEPANITETKKRKVMRTGGEWKGENDKSQLPSFYKGGFNEFCALIGIYVADGHCKNKSLVFGNIPPHKQEIFTKIAKESGYDAKMYGSDLYINSSDLSNYMKSFGKAKDKYIPQFIKNGSKKAIIHFLEGYGSGDGTRKHGNLSYSTISKRLSDDLQEVCLKAGYATTVNIRDRRNDPPHLIAGFMCYNREIEYCVGVSKIKKLANLSPEMAERVAYDGKVYCCTVTSHIIYVRRNGKSCFLGQTGEQGTLTRYTENSKLAEMMLEPIIGELFRCDYTGYVDVSVLIDKQGNPWPLEFTSRPGWPLFQIQQALHPDPVEWMYDLLEGNDTFEPLDKIACGVVVAIPDYPYSRVTKKENSGYPVWGLNSKNRHNFHPCEMMMGEGPVKSGDSIKNEPMMVSAGDYVYVASGTGNTVSKAQGAAYGLIDQLTLPNSPMYRTDIGCRLEKQLPELQKHDFAKDWKY